jgi:hypothetical protein
LELKFGSFRFVNKDGHFLCAIKQQYQNGSERLECPDKDGSSESLLIDHPTFEEWLRTLEGCPGLLASECRESKTILDFHKAKAALARWRSARFPRPEEPPEGWKNQVWAYTQEWADLYQWK